MLFMDTNQSENNFGIVRKLKKRFWGLLFIAAGCGGVWPITATLFGMQPVSPLGGGDPHWAIPIEQYLEDEQTGIVDFSYAGYMANEQPLPNAPVKVLVKPTAGDDGQRIQAALDYVGRLQPDAAGIRGAVLLAPGDYDIADQLLIRHAGVVLRGSGPEQDGTRLIAAGQGRRTLIRILGRDDKSRQSPVTITEPVSTGSATVKLSAVKDLKPGDHVFITRPSTEEWIVSVNMSKIWNAKKAPRVWKAGELDIVWDRQIKSIEGNTVILDAPLSMDINPDETGGALTRYNWPGRIRQVGVENLQLVSAYDKERPKDEDHAWVGITMEHTRDAWVRGVTFRHFAGSAVSVWETASRVTVVDCLSLEPVSENGGWRRHTFFTAGQQTLFLRCFSEHGRHDFSTGHCAPGPNAFVHCNARMALEDSGPIGAWATGVLYDNVNIDGNALRLGYRGTQLQFAGWTAVNCMLWQSTASQIDCYRPPQGQNWAIGCWAMFEGDGHWAAFNEFVNPKSLMQALVENRVGQKAGAFIGDGIVHPPGSTRPSVEQAQMMAANSNRPAPQLTEVINNARRQYALSLDSENAVSIEKILKENPDLLPAEPEPATKQLVLSKGQLTIDGKPLTGKTLNTYWWRSSAVPQSIAFKRAKPELVRFVPGRVGKGWTDDLDVMTTQLADDGYAAVYQHPGLWYDRRRQDHERVRRSDGEVWIPFDEMPFARSGQGTAWDGLSRYDLTRYNPWYFNRLKTFAKLAERKGLVLLNNHYFQHNILEAGAHWADFPWRSVNNINDTGFPEPAPYAGDKRIFQAHLFYDASHPVRRKLHEAYIRHHLEALSDYPNVIHMTSGEYTGPLAFTQFWLDTIGQWERETGKQVLTALSCTYDVQEAILNDPERAAVVDIIDIRYWSPQADGAGKGPRGGINLSPRQQGMRGGTRSNPDAFKTAVKRYRQRFPDKAVICSDMGFQLANENNEKDK